MKKEEIFEYVKKQYGTVPEYLWAQSPDNAVLRHKNGKFVIAVFLDPVTISLGKFWTYQCTHARSPLHT